MDTSLLIALAATSFLIILGFTFFLRKTPQTKAENRPQAGPPRLRDGVPRRAQLARNRGGRHRPLAVAQDPDASENEDDVNVHEPNVDVPDGKIGAKKRAKLEAKAEKKAQREAEEVNRAEKKKKEQQSEIERQKLKELQKAEEDKKAEEERNILEEKKRQEHEEYLKMKEAFLVEEEGFEEDGGEDETNWLQEFLNYIKMKKVVIIEDLAAHFKLKSQAAIDRIKDLQRDDILTGVIDDRGKFIYIAEQEIQDVAKFIRQRGRVSISELVENSNKLINLVPVSTK